MPLFLCSTSISHLPQRFVFSFSVIGAFKRANARFANDMRFDKTGQNHGTQTGGVFVVGPGAAPDFSYVARAQAPFAAM